MPPQVTQRKVSKVRNGGVVYPELSYVVVGLLYDIYNALGFGLREKQYERAIAVALEHAGVAFKRQYHVPVTYEGKKVGDYFLDFLVEGKIALELKQGSVLPRRNVEQVYSYLRAADLKLGIIAQFTAQGLKYKRIVNLDNSYIRQHS